MFPYDAEVLASSYRLYNTAIWPAQPVALMLALAALWLAVAPRPWSRRAVGVILAAGWLWCGLVFFLSHWAQLDFMAPVFGGAFLLPAVLLLFAPQPPPRPFCAPAGAALLPRVARQSL